MNTYFYFDNNDALLGFFNAENITKADAMAAHTGIKVNSTVTSIGAVLFAYEYTEKLFLMHKGKVIEIISTDIGTRYKFNNINDKSAMELYHRLKHDKSVYEIYWTLPGRPNFKLEVTC